ncbi:MAG: membrane protein insertase YidC [Gammaproteobacteria bacterium]|nr:membrane protein insertase YidC [Gammaproteobacteria bacterium]
MNLLRYPLYFGLAIVTYLMLLAWQEDNPSLLISATDPIRNDQLNRPALGNSLDTPALVSENITTQLPTSEEVPTLAQQTTKPGPIVNTEELISISTDTLNAQVSLSGGDIVYLSLPKYLKNIDIKEDPFVILDNQNNLNYMAQSGLIGPNGIDSPERARYSAAGTNFSLDESEDSLIIDLIHIANDNILITKRFKFSRGSYLIDVSYIVNNSSEEIWRANAFGQIKRDQFEDPSSAGGFSRTYLGFVSTTTDDPYIEIELEDIDDNGTTTNQTEGGWIAFSQHYFLTAWIPDKQQLNRFTTRKNGNAQYFGEFTSAEIVVPPNQTVSYSASFYAGPKDQYELAEIAPNLDLTIDYSFLWFLASPIYWLLTKINSVVDNYGFSIIMLTIFVKIIFYKLSETQYRSMAGMRRLMPKAQQLKDSYGDDKMKLQKATMELYKKEKINPLGGCLPMIVQMPVFIALYWVLLESVELRHAPFILWLTDLSVRDPYFILPLLMGATMYLQTSLSPAPADPMQAKVMKLMPVMMTGIFLFFPAGLVLYWFVNAALGIMQQWYITRKIEAQYANK